MDCRGSVSFFRHSLIYNFLRLKRVRVIFFVFRDLLFRPSLINTKRMFSKLIIVVFVIVCIIDFVAFAEDFTRRPHFGFRRKFPKVFKRETCGRRLVNDLSSYLRIIGGRESRPGSWPWQVMILNKYYEPFCGGTLIHPQFVLTAAHCVRSRLYVRAGEHDLLTDEEREQEQRVVKTITHPDYDIETVDNDIALLKLRRPFKMSKYVSVACLPSSNTHLDVDALGTILGWGKKKDTAIFGSDVLHQAQVPIVSPSDCKVVYEDYFISQNMVCAGYKKGRVDSCAGDSGGPLLFERNGQWLIYGITSFGEGCGKKGKYGIYAKVPNFVNWIKRTIRKQERARYRRRKFRKQSRIH